MKHLLKNLNLVKEIEKQGKIDDVIKANQNLLVQIIKEPISTKGPRISSELSFAGRFLVLIPFSNRISVSQKIRSKDERNRLKDLIEEFREPIIILFLELYFLITRRFVLHLEQRLF